MKMFNLLVLLLFLVHASFAQPDRWKEGILVDEFIYTSAPFPSCHSATIAETGKGLVAAWFGGTKERHPDVGIWVSRNVRGKWTTPVEVANGVVNDTLRYACWNPVLYQVPGGALMLFYKTGPNVSAWVGWMKVSKDGGITWSSARQLPEGLLGPVKNQPVRLGNGDILCASSTEGDGWKVHFELIPAGGGVWRKIGSINDGVEMPSIQPAILDHGNNKLQILCRSKSRSITESWSLDNGATWSPLAVTSMPNNNSGIGAVTLKDGRHVLVYNHVKTPEGEKKGARTPLNVAISPDGKKWFAALVLEDSPISQYSYPSVIQSKDGMIHVVYTWRREKIKYVKIDAAKLNLTEIKDEMWP